MLKHLPTEKARLFKTARLTLGTVEYILVDQAVAQYRTRPARDKKSLLSQCFSVEFLEMRPNTYTLEIEPVFNLREADGTFFGYFFESALHLGL